MVRNAEQNTTRPGRIAAAMQQSPDDSGEYMWPLTSAGADGLRLSPTAPDEHQSSRAHPAMPQTLCESEPNREGCPGMVAEPLN